MKKFTLLVVFIFSFFSCEHPKEITTFYLIRHAEKDRSNPSDRNPNLTEEGENRAANWAKYFSDIELDAVYSTNYNRTLQTAKPTAESKNLEIKKYDPRTLYNLEFESETDNKSVLIVGHSNTTPVFANMILKRHNDTLRKNTFSYMDDKDNASLYIVTITKQGTEKSVNAEIVKVGN